MTALADALAQAGHVLPPVRPDIERDPQTRITYWNRPCGHQGCTTWVPKHRRYCAAHPEENR